MIVVYDVTSGESFVNVKRWLQEIDQNCDTVNRILGQINVYVHTNTYAHTYTHMYSRSANNMYMCYNSQSVYMYMNQRVYKASA